MKQSFATLTEFDIDDLDPVSRVFGPFDGGLGFQDDANTPLRDALRSYIVGRYESDVIATTIVFLVTEFACVDGVVAETCCYDWDEAQFANDAIT